jgi:hypothetical protein
MPRESKAKLGDKKRWTTPDQTAFLKAKVADYLVAQSEGKTTRFFSLVDKEWFDRWSERNILYPPSSPDEEPPALSPIAVLDLQRAIASRKTVSQFVIIILEVSHQLKAPNSNYERGLAGTHAIIPVVAVSPYLIARHVQRRSVLVDFKRSRSIRRYTTISRSSLSLKRDMPGRR